LFYTNFQQVGNNILFSGVKDDKRFLEKIPYKPYVFIKSDQESKYKNLQGQQVSQVKFDSIREAREFYKTYSDVSNMDIFGFEKFMYVCISDLFDNKKVPYDRSQIVEWFLDIETIGDGSFPDIETANQEIVAVTIRIKDTRWVFGLKDFQTTDPNIMYIKFENELALLTALVNFFKSPIHRPDVITGWYIEFFDIPYMVNRIKRILGEAAAKSLSPWGILNEREIEIRGRLYKVYVPLGISILDYIGLYKKFTQNAEESYSLEYISQKILNVGKLDYSQYDGLTDLYERNPQLFIEYNIVDSDRVYEIDQKLKFLDRVYAIAYDAKVNYNDALTSVLLWDVLIHNDLKKYNIVVPPLKKQSDARRIPGGYVKEPLSQMYNWVLSFDLTSLYPHLIIQHNISPETFVRNTHTETYDDNQRLYDYDVVAQQIKDIKDGLQDDYSITANGCLYRKDKQGFLGRLMEEQFNQRVVLKEELKEVKKLKQTIEEELFRRGIKINTP
jgi:DNA polymerase elongation subunit (family B)